MTRNVESGDVASDAVNTAVAFSYLETAKISLTDAASFIRLSGRDPKSVIDAVLRGFEKKVGTFPLSCPVSPQLLTLGVSKYRECNISDYRITYDYDDKSKIVSVYVILHHKQDVKELLFRRLIQP